MRPDPPLDQATSTVTAFQEIRSNGSYYKCGEQPKQVTACYQGISVGWVDQYHQATDGQQVDLTGVPNGNDYYLVSTSNADGVFLEQD